VCLWQENTSFFQLYTVNFWFSDYNGDNNAHLIPNISPPNISLGGGSSLNISPVAQVLCYSTLTLSFNILSTCKFILLLIVRPQSTKPKFSCRCCFLTTPVLRVQTFHFTTEKPWVFCNRATCSTIDQSKLQFHFTRLDRGLSLSICSLVWINACVHFTQLVSFMSK
jgi:hypothetical protein